MDGEIWYKIDIDASVYHVNKITPDINGIACVTVDILKSGMGKVQVL